MKTVHINRTVANENKAKDMTDDEGKWSCFGTVCREMTRHKYEGMNIKDSGNKSKPWHSNFKGEAALDDGGLFGECMSVMSTELHSDVLSLFIPCAN